MVLTETEQQILSFFHHDIKDKYGRTTVQIDGHKYYYRALIKEWKKATDLSDEQIRKAVIGLHQKYLIDYDGETIQLRPEGAEAYMEYRDALENCNAYS